MSVLCLSRYLWRFDVNLRHLYVFFATADDDDNVCPFTGSMGRFIALHFIVNIEHYYATNKNLLRFATVFARSYYITG